jgi:hypothetical protein
MNAKGGKYMGVESKSTGRQVLVEVIPCPKNASIPTSMNEIHFVRKPGLR